MSGDPAYQRLRAPRLNRGVLMSPTIAQAVDDAQANAELLSDANTLFLGEPLAAWRQATRREVAGILGREEGPLAERADYIQADDVRAEYIFCGGHQPELFHPGVWFKNFVLARLARETGGRALNLVIDNDLCRQALIGVPGGSPESPTVTQVPFDAPGALVPWEERSVLDERICRAFPGKVQQSFAQWPIQPLLGRYWSRVLAHVGSGEKMGSSLAAGRVDIERAWGLENSELPLSRLCQTESYRRLVCRLCARADDFRQVHNNVLANYRRQHKLRTAAQPVPDLELRRDWRELPCWLWSVTDPQRRRAYVRPATQGWELGDGERAWLTLPREDSAAMAAIAQGEHEGIKIRPRALLTTLFVRLLVADQFVHGIGGATYDTATNAMIEGLTGGPAPRFVTATATLWLPVPHTHVSPTDEAAADVRLRELAFHGERYLAATSPTEALRLAEEKRRLLREIPPRGARGAWHASVTRLNAALQPYLAREASEAHQRLAVLRTARASAAVLENREFAACLYPEEFLRDALLAFSAELT